MANTKSAKKNIRSSSRKKSHNDMWESKFKSAKKSLSKSITDKDSNKIIGEKFITLQRSLDRAAKEKVIHKNKANRVKSNYAKKIAALTVQEGDESKSKSPRKRSTKKQEGK